MSFVDVANEEFTRVNEDQESKGIEKYGHSMKPLEPKWDWLQMAKEEFVDGFKYLVAESERRNFYINLALTEIHALQSSHLFMENSEIRERLKKVEHNLLILIGGIK